MVDANRHGQQLFLVDLFHDPNRRRAAFHPPAGYEACRSFRPVTYRQLVLCERPPTLRPLGRGGYPEPADGRLACFLDQVAREYAARHDWPVYKVKNVRQGIRVLLGLQDTPGAVIKASEAAVLRQIDLPVSHVIDVLDAAGMLDDDRVSAIESWFIRQIRSLPEPMASELRVWFEVMRHGSTTPRCRPRSPITIRTRVYWVMPTLRAWAAAGHDSLREISRQDVIGALPADGTPRATLGTGLRSIFGVLKARKLVFVNPVTGIRTGRPETREPLPADLSIVRDALHSADPARAALAALLAFHGLRPRQLRNMLLTDVRDGRVHIDGQTILLAEPVRERLAAYLHRRASRWPESPNPHLFIHTRTAANTKAVHRLWINRTLGIAAQTIREDRILDEAQASAGDIRRLCDLFGLSVPGAIRYTATIDHPGIIEFEQRRGRPTGTA